MPPSWMMTEKGKEALRLASGMAKVKHGLYASVPIVCKGQECPYIETCGLDLYGMTPEGERCPLEIAEAIKTFEEYCAELEIDQYSRVDLGLLKELIDIEITLIRADKVIASDPALIQEIAVAINPRGDQITRPELHKAYELKDRLNRRKHEVLRLLNSTRKDKAGDIARSIDPSTYAAELIRRYQESQNAIEAEDYTVVDVETDELKLPIPGDEK